MDTVQSMQGVFQGPFTTRGTVYTDADYAAYMCPPIHGLLTQPSLTSLQVRCVVKQSEKNGKKNLLAIYIALCAAFSQEMQKIIVATGSGIQQFELHCFQLEQNFAGYENC